MKGSTSKAVPSPGRVDNHPPPLMRFLSSKVGSRSTGRSSRGTSLFMRRKRTTAIEAQEEPSSPEVTCIGQVRVRRPSSKSKPPSDAVPRNRFCYWLGKPPAFCDFLHVSLCRRRRWRRWVSFFLCRSIRVRTSSSKTGSNPTIDCYNAEEERRRDEEREEEVRKSIPTESYSRVCGSDSSAGPPKNALLLARCGSAPQRSSYLASRLWGSPVRTEEEEMEKTGTAKEEEELGSLEIEQIPKDTAPESRINGEGEDILEICKEDPAVKKAAEAEVGSNKPESSTLSPTTQNSNAVVVVKAVVLTRSKSEPARRSGDPLTSSFWKEMRFESSTYSAEINN